jgi:RimJ/RimL family protein N-acetyltransferase
VKLSPPAHPLSDGELCLRPWEDRDARAITAACREEEIARWLDMIPQPYSEKDAHMYVEHTKEAWREGTGGAFAVVHVANGEVLGSIGLRVVDADNAVAEVGYWVKGEARGRRVATRALRLVSRWAFADVGVERLQLRADVLNEPSRHVAENAGFREEGVLRSMRFFPRQDRRVDFVIYSLLPSELERV